MLKFYYHPFSPNARRVWLALLEKAIPFEPVTLRLDGDQHEPEFAAINPFRHVPVIVDDGLRVVESLAILDYLDRQYPDPALLPQDGAGLARVRMVQMVSVNELGAAVFPLMDALPDSALYQRVTQQLTTGLDFLAEQLGDRPYFGGQQFTQADIVAGTVVRLLPRLGVAAVPANLADWSQDLLQRTPWQQTELTDEEFRLWQRRVRLLVKLRQRELRQAVH